MELSGSDFIIMIMGDNEPEEDSVQEIVFRAGESDIISLHGEQRSKTGGKAVNFIHFYNDNKFIVWFAS